MRVLRRSHSGTSLRSVTGLASAALVFGACGGAAVGSGSGVASEAEWRELREPRPEPLPGAVEVTVSEVQFMGAYPWPEAARVPTGLGVSELVVANLLRRRDVRFVERRRFAEAARAERRGDPRPPGRPPAGVSAGAEYGVTAVWIPTTAGAATVEVRLARLETGSVDGATRVSVERSVPPVELGRAITRAILEVLDELDRRPAWADPMDETANRGAPGRVSTEALQLFLRGLAAEESWNWEGARRGYQQALEAAPHFHEARAALARAARLRLGGTLAES